MEDTKWYKKSEMIVAFAALFISMVTAAVGIYSAYIDRQYVLGLRFGLGWLCTMK